MRKSSSARKITEKGDCACDRHCYRQIVLRIFRRTSASGFRRVALKFLRRGRFVSKYASDLAIAALKTRSEREDNGTDGYPAVTPAEEQQNYQRGQHPRAERGGNETKIRLLSKTDTFHFRRGLVMPKPSIAKFAAKLTPPFSPNNLLCNSGSVSQARIRAGGRAVTSEGGAKHERSEAKSRFRFSRR
jgi:hypothetical protein